MRRVRTAPRLLRTAWPVHYSGDRSRLPSPTAPGPWLLPERGGTLVLYTDGLVERRGESLDAGLDRLVTAVSEGPRGPDALCRHLLDAVLPGDAAEDDVALLVVDQFAARLVPGTPAGQAGGAGRAPAAASRLADQA